MSVKPPRQGKLLLAAVTFDMGRAQAASKTWKGHLEGAGII